MLTKEKLELLSKPAWNYKDIMSYFGYKSQNTAIRIKNEAIKLGGRVRFSTTLASTDSIIQYMGSSREREIKCLTAIVGENHETI